MSDFLFTNPSFLFGFAKAFDLMGVFDEFNSSSSSEEADQRAHLADAMAVGEDFKKVITAQEQEMKDASHG